MRNGDVIRHDKMLFTIQIDKICDLKLNRIVLICRFHFQGSELLLDLHSSYDQFEAHLIVIYNQSFATFSTQVVYIFQKQIHFFLELLKMKKKQCGQ